MQTLYCASELRPTVINRSVIFHGFPRNGTASEVLLDARLIIETTDATFTEWGGIGVWTKADAATSFDDLLVRGTNGN